ncbi:MAG: DUF378 domain-containing protein [Candidatus Korobacteraceae bacterium]
MTTLSKTMLVITIIGAMNWLLIGLFGFNLVAAMFGSMTVLSRLIYVIVGIAGLYCLTLLGNRRRYAREHDTVEMPRRIA